MKQLSTWPKFRVMKFLELLQRRESRAGLSSAYVPWPGREGVRSGLKIFTLRRDRTFARTTQLRAAKHGLGPAVGPSLSFSIVVPQPQVVYYEVEGQKEDEARAELRAEFSTVEFHAYWTAHAQRVRRWCKGIEVVQKQLDEIGIDHFDLGSFNVGRINGELVCIDFGWESCERF